MKSTFLTGLRPNHADHRRRETGADPGKGGRQGNEEVEKDKAPGRSMLGLTAEGEDMESSGTETPRAGHVMKPRDKTPDRNGEELSCTRDGLDRIMAPEGSEDEELNIGNCSKKKRAYNVADEGAEKEDYYEGTNRDKYVMEGHDCQHHQGCGSQDVDYIALMQRRQRGRSPSPRRRRRHRAEAARRAARARWTIRGTPSRAPPPERTRTSSTRAFPPAPWSRRATTEATEEEEAVCLEEPEEEAAGSARNTTGPATGRGAAIPG